MRSATLEMDGWETGMKFAAAHFIPGLASCSRIHGHNYAVSLKISGEISDHGIVLDFNIIKERVRMIASALDHRVLIPSSGDDVKITEQGNAVQVEFEGKRYVFPASEVVLLPVEHTSAEELASYIAESIRKAGILSPNIASLEVGVAEGRGQEAWFRLDLK